MDVVQAQVEALFARGGGRSTKVGIEHELVAVDRATGRPPSLALVREAVCGASYAEHLGFEPGGQVELSLPCAHDAPTAARRLREEVGALRADCRRHGIDLYDVPVDPRPETEVPLQLSSDRYRSMQRHFDTIGPAGRRMMRRTTSTQVCLDWWPGDAGLEQWRLLNLAGPLLAAAFARSVGPGSRLATWLAVDPSRTAFDRRLLRGPCPVSAYAEFARGAVVFVGDGDVGTHLTTLFPPVRPRGGYLEVRFLDVQPPTAVGEVTETLTALLYDDHLRASTLRRLEPEAPLLDVHWRAAALGDAGLRARGRALVAAARATTAGSVGAA